MLLIDPVLLYHGEIKHVQGLLLYMLRHYFHYFISTLGDPCYSSSGENMYYNLVYKLICFVIIHQSTVSRKGLEVLHFFAKAAQK